MHWTAAPSAAEHFLRQAFSSAGVPVALQPLPDGAPVARVRLDAPIGPDVLVSARLLGDSVRLVAHAVVQGALDEGALADFNAVNQAPWWGRLIPSSEQGHIDLALGAPAPVASDSPFPLSPLLYLLLAGAADVRSGAPPQERGQPGEAPALVLSRASAWLEREGPVSSRFDGEVLVSRRHAHGHPVELEVFVWHETVLCARARPVQSAVDGSPPLLAALATYNRGTAAGAAAWRPELRQVYGSASVFPHLFPVDERILAWTVERALDCAAGAMWARDRASAHPSPA